jgi:hypothetical protein
MQISKEIIIIQVLSAIEPPSLDQLSLPKIQVSQSSGNKIDSRPKSLLRRYQLPVSTMERSKAHLK